MNAATLLNAAPPCRHATDEADSEAAMVAHPYILPLPSSPIASPARPSSGVVIVFHAVIVRRPTTTIVKRRYPFAAILH
jgi:hypothetical protein